MLFVLLTAILLRWLKIAPPLSQPCPLTGVTGVWYDRIHDGSVAPPMLFVLLTAISLGLKLLHLLCFCPHYSNQFLVRPDTWQRCSISHVLLTAILLRRLKIAPPLSRPCPLTGVTGVWYDRIHDCSVAPPMLFLLLTAILLGLKLLHLLSVCVLSLG